MAVHPSTTLARRELPTLVWSDFSMRTGKKENWTLVGWHAINFNFNVYIYVLTSHVSYRFEIYATRDIEAGDELLHTYISLKWRTCFQEPNEIVHADDSEHKTMD